MNCRALDFVAPTNRDAWAAINGFYYQAGTTILRWIELKPGELLELERGEDIDLITEALSEEDPSEAKRQLEQVKRRGKNVTLRSPAAREAIRNAFTHHQRNPGLRIVFRFTTNAIPGREKGWDHARYSKGIVAWEALRQGDAEGDDIEEIVELLRPLLVGGSEENSTAFREFVTDSPVADFVAFVRRFEWSTGRVDTPDIGPRIVQLLVDRGFAATRVDAELIYPQLMLQVYDVLSQPGLKRLDSEGLSEALDEQKDLLSKRDERILGRLMAMHEALTERVSSLEKTVTGIEELVGASQASMEALAAQVGLEASPIGLDLLVPNLSEPAMVAYPSAREETIERILPSSGTPVLLGLHGASASGKTQLALAVSKKLGPRRIWIRLSDSEPIQASRTVKAAIARLAAESGTGANSLEDALSEVDVLVLDDLPELRQADALGVLLTPLLELALERGISVITTSAVPVEGLGNRLEPSKVISVAVPPLTSQEVEDILKARGAPSPLTGDGFSELLTGLTLGHPVLVQAAGKYLENQNWRVDLDVLRELLGKSYAVTVQQDTIRRLLLEVSDGSTRKLLYRLTLLDDGFSLEEAQDLAKVHPPIAAVREKLESVRGAWLQATGPGTYSLSPLVKDLGTEDLQDDVRRECHAVLARKIMSKRQLNPWEAAKAVMHFSAAGEYDSAGFVLALALNAGAEAEEDLLRESLDLPGAIWSEMPLPAGMEPGMQAIVRAHQAVFALARGRSYDFAIADLNRIAEKGEARDWSIAMASLRVATGFSQAKPDVATKHAARAARLWSSMRSAIREAGLDEEAAVPVLSPVVWVASAALRTPADLRNWLEMLREMPVAMVRESFSTELAREGANVTLTRLVATESEKPQGERQWNEILTVVQEAEVVGNSLDLDPLRTSAVAAQCVVLVEMGRTEEAEEMASRVQEEWARHPDSVFNVLFYLGLALLDADDRHRSLKWFTEADDTPGELYRSLRVRTKVRRAQFNAEQDELEEAVSVVTEAAALAEEPEAPLLEGFAPSQGGGKWNLLRTTARGELGVAMFLNENTIGAAQELLTAMERLFKEEDETDTNWRAAAAQLRYTAGYVGTILSTGSLPGEEGEHPPLKLGDIMFPDLHLAEQFQSRHRGFLAHFAMQLAVQLGDIAQTRTWAERVVAWNRDESLWSAAVVGMSHLLDIQIAAGELKPSLATAFDWAATTATQRDERPLDEPSPHPRDLLGPRSSPEWAEVDHMVLRRCVLPWLISMAGAESGKERVDLARELELIALDEAKNSPVSGTWKRVAEICASVADGATSEELTAIGNQVYEEKGATGGAEVGVGAYLLSSVADDCGLNRAVSLHYATADFLVEGLGAYDSFRTTVLPFFWTYWRNAVSKSRFRFTAPDQVEQSLNAAEQAAIEDQLPKLLQAVSFGLGYRPPRKQG